MMKLHNLVHCPKQKTLLSLGGLFLIFLSSGCVDQFQPKLNIDTCKNAQNKVSQVQAQYDEVTQKLVNQPQNEDRTSRAGILQQLEESQEQAFEICERVD